MLFRLFQVFLAYVFLSGKLANPDPPPLSGKFHYFFFYLKPSLIDLIDPFQASIYSHVISQNCSPKSLKDEKMQRRLAKYPTNYDGSNSISIPSFSQPGVKRKLSRRNSCPQMKPFSSRLTILGSHLTLDEKEVVETFL